MSKRRFTHSERSALFLAADGRCAECGRELEPGWHADHITPYVAGGPTDVTNGQALCPNCNLRKGYTVNDLREWQQNAIDRYYEHDRRDFLVSATPGAGKTTFDVNTQILKAGFPQRPKASVDQLEHIRDYLTRWLDGLS